RVVRRLAEELRADRDEDALERVAVVRLRQVLGRPQPRGPLADARHEHLLLVAHDGVQLPLRDPGALGDLERGGGGVARLDERREGRIEDAPSHRHVIDDRHPASLTWYPTVPYR